MKRATILCMILLFVSFTAYADNARHRAHQIDRRITEGDIEAEIEFGKDVAARIIGKYSLYKDDELTKYVNLVGKSLALSSSRPEIEFTVGILDSKIINAFAAPGGYIFITKGAIDAMDDEAQLAAVIAHEMTHIAQKHIVKELNIHGSESSPVSGFARLIGGATDTAKVAFVKAVDEAVSILFERGYKKKDEIEADTLGAVLAGSLDYDPSALVRYFQKIKGKEGETLSSLKKLHPTFDERITWIEKTIEEEGLSGKNYTSGRKRFHEHAKRKS